MNIPRRTHALGDLFEIARGGSPRPIEKFVTADPDGLNWVKIGDATASGRFIDRTKEKIRPEGLSKTRQVHPGDFLLTNSMSFGRPYIMATDGCIHDGWLLLRPRDEHLIDRGYFYHLLSSPGIYAQFASRAAGATVKNLNTEIVSGVRVQLPPLDEQRQIAAILDKVDALRQKRKRAIALLDSLTQSIFLDMFGHPLLRPGTEPLEAVARFLGGATPSKADKSFWNGQIPWVSPKDMKVDVIADSEDHVDVSAIERSPLQLIPSKSTLIVVRGMILAHTFPTAMTEGEVTINQDMKAVVFSDIIHPEFGYWCLRSLSEYVLSKVSTAAHGTRKLDMGVVRSLPVIVAPNAEQERFVKLAREAKRALGLSVSSERGLRDCFVSMQQQAFPSGEEMVG